MLGITTPPPQGALPNNAGMMPGPMMPTVAPPAPMMVGGPQQTSIGGIMSVMSAKGILEEQKRKSDLQQAQPIITGIAAHVRHCWSVARTAREQTIETRMFQSVRQRRGEYDPDKLSKIRSQGGSEIYMMLTSAKCRGAAAWLRDVLLGAGNEKPWTLKPTPLPSLPPTVMMELRQRAINELSMYMQVTGQQVPPTELRKFLTGLREEYYNSLYEEAKSKAVNMERKMEDQLLEGGFLQALDQFIDDITTFPAAFLKGPVVRNKPKLKWKQTGEGQYEPDVADELVLEWERVDPFMCYPSPSSSGIDDGFFIERHKMRQQDLEELIGVEGYDDGAIRSVLEDYGRGGLQEWLIVDSSKAMAEGRSTTAVAQNVENTIDALQFWGSVSGQMLRDWGLTEEEVPDTAKTTPVRRG